METINITNGVNLRLINGDKFGFVTMSILFRQPLQRDMATANALLSLMLLSGSKSYKNRRLLEMAFEQYEGAVVDTSVIKKGNEQIIQIYARFKQAYTEDICCLLNDIIFNPVFNNEQVEKNILKNIILSQINNKRQYAFSQFMEKIYDDVNADGYVEDIDAIDINKEYKRAIENSLIEILVVGGNKGIIEKCVKQYFTFTDRNINNIELKKLTPVKTRYIEDSDVLQSKICVGLQCDFGCKGIEYARLMVANDIFSSGANSKLYAKAREDENLCYYITGRLFRFNSLITIEAGISSDSVDKTVEIIKSAIHQMKTETIEKQDIEQAKTSIINGYKTIGDKPDAIMNFYVNQIMADDDRDIPDVIECIKSVEDINGVFDSCYMNTLYVLRGEL